MRSLLLALAFGFGLAGPGLAADYRAGDLQITAPWSRATPPGSPVAGGFVEIRNNGGAADRLLAVRSPAAQRVELHETAMEGGVMRMREMADGIPLPPGAVARLAPGGLHIMLIGLKQPLQQGERFAAELVFEKAGTVPVEFEVLGIGAQRPQ